MHSLDFSHLYWWIAGPLENPNSAGSAYAVNVTGCIVGPLTAGFLLLPTIGERWATFVLAAPLFVIAGFTAMRFPVPASEQLNPKVSANVKSWISILAAAVIFAVSHDYASQYPVREVRRDYTATVVATGKGFDRDLL